MGVLVQLMVLTCNLLTSVHHFLWVPYLNNLSVSVSSTLSLHLSFQSVQTTWLAGLETHSVITLSSLSNLPLITLCIHFFFLLYLTLTLTLTFHFVMSDSTSNHTLTIQYSRFGSGANPRQEHPGFQPYSQHSERSLGGCHRPSPAVPGGLCSSDWRQALWVGEFPSTV